MKLDLTGIHIDVTEGIKDYAERKIERLSKFFGEDTLVHVTYSAKKEKQHVDIRIEHKGHTFMSEVDGESVYACIDECIDLLEAQARKAKEKDLAKRMDKDPVSEALRKDLESAEEE